MNAKLTILLAIAFASITTQAAIANEVPSKPYGYIQGGTLLVTREGGETVKITLYHGCKDCNQYDSYSYYLEYTGNGVNAENPEQVVLFEIENIDASIDLDLRAPNKQLNATRALYWATRRDGSVSPEYSRDVREIGQWGTFVADGIASPFIGLGNGFLKIFNSDIRCAHHALGFLRDRSQVGADPLPVSEACAVYLVNQIEG